MQRICVPYSYIERVVHHCHTGALGSSMHTGQVSTWDKVNATYAGISRDIVRMFVKKCAVCQQHAKRVHKAALVPITAKTLFERVVIDLIDFSNSPSHGYHYILHAVDHYSKFHWAWALQDKRPATVAYHINCLLADTGPIQYMQCDRGVEFVAEVLQALEDFNCGRMVNSTAYHPQTNGLVERGNGMLKTALDHWFVQENTLDWYPPLARIRYQLNCNKPRTTKYTPYELVYGKKPPDWEALNSNSSWPLNMDTLGRVLNGSPPADEAPSPADPAASILTSMANGQPGITEPQPSPSPPSARSQLPLPQSQLPAEEPRSPPADPDIYPNVTYDLPSGAVGPVNKAMADQLNVGCHFVRLGGEGGGRCAMSAFYNALAPMEYLHLTSAERVERLDSRRREMRATWEQLNTDSSPASRKKRKDLRVIVGDVPFSGDERDAPLNPDMDLALEERRERAWQELGTHLGHSTTSLGVEAIAIMAYEHGVNVLLYVSHSQVTHFGRGTKQAVERWRKASAQERQDQQRLRRRNKQPPGHASCGWLQVESDTTAFFVPDFITQDRPWMVLYQRTTAEFMLRKDGNEVVTTSIPANGHYEAVVKQTITDGAPLYVGVYRMGDDTANEYDSVLQVATRLEAYNNAQAHSTRMAADYDSKANPVVYRHLEAVGVRVPGKNPRKGSTHSSLPCLVVDVQKQTVKGSGNTIVIHRLYTLWCPHGVLKGKVKVDKLVPLSINNFPELLHLRDDQLTARQRLAEADPNWLSPMNTVRDVATITLKTAWKRHLEARTQRTVDMSRQRSVPARMAADAAATSIAAGEADGRAALSLSTVTNQAVPRSYTGSRSPSRIVRILRENKTTYRVQWSRPEDNPEENWVNRGWLDKHADYINVVLNWREEQQRRKDNVIVFSD
jgi:hypothetical protein